MPNNKKLNENSRTFKISIWLDEKLNLNYRLNRDMLSPSLPELTKEISSKTDMEICDFDERKLFVSVTLTTAV